jgi:Fructose-2,6-bisphosphatase
MKIFIIRHCESEDDILNCYGGCADFDLTEAGRKTAENHSNELVDLNIEKIFTSPYKRAKNVAKIFSDKINCELEIVNDLREINTYGVMAGTNKDLAKEIFSLLLEREEYKSFGYYTGKSFEGGEDVTKFDSRVKGAIEYLANQDYETVALVTHGGVFRSIYKNILNKSEKILEIEDVGTIEVDYIDGEFSIVSMSGIETE